MKKTLTALAILLLVGIVGFFLLNRHIYEEKQADLSPYSYGSYGYRCEDGTEFVMSPAADMTTILITPATSVERISQVILTKVESESGARYEGDGITFFGQGESVTLSTSEFSASCVPQGGDGAPFNFGD